MPLDLSAVGAPGERVEVSWTSTDALTYALGVGAGQSDPLRELAFTTENTHDIVQQVLPTFASVLPQRSRGQSARRIGTFDPAMLVHAEQAVIVHRPLQAAGHLVLRATITGIYDKGTGALVVTETTGIDAAGELAVTLRSAAFIRGEGGFGGGRGEDSSWAAPERPPDTEIRYRTRPEQALLYRLSGDRNPLHSDPSFARRAGFDRPILHGLCTYGFTGRALVQGLCGGDATQLASVSGRFSAPVVPGDELVVSIWRSGLHGWFRTVRGDGTVVLDRGSATVRPAS